MSEWWMWILNSVSLIIGDGRINEWWMVKIVTSIEYGDIKDDTDDASVERENKGDENGMNGVYIGGGWWLMTQNE